jgi:hypothetical protein
VKSQKVELEKPFIFKGPIVLLTRLKGGWTHNWEKRLKIRWCNEKAYRSSFPSPGDGQGGKRILLLPKSNFITILNRTSILACADHMQDYETKRKDS